MEWHKKHFHIPYLAQGAVIPPNQQFMAILGDQKNGNNLEGPESLFRQIVREESGNNGNNVYSVNVQMGRKTLLQFVIDEAKMAQARTGKNPFELAGVRRKKHGARKNHF